MTSGLGFPMATALAAGAARGRSSSQLTATHIGIALVFVSFWAALGSVVIEGAKNHDFLNLYTGARLAAQGRFSELHDPQIQLALEREIVPATPELVPFVRPHFYAALLAPLSLLDFDSALAAWVGLHTALLTAIWLWGARRFGPDALILGAMFLPAPLGIAHGQDGVFMMAVVAGCWALAHKGRDGAAGVVLSLGLAKFHLLLCAPLGLALARRWSMLRGFAAGGAALALVSVALGGWTGAQRYVALLRMKDLNRLSPSPELMINVHSIGVNLGIGGVELSAALVCLVLGMLVAAAWKAPLGRFLPATLAASLLVAPHIYGYDAAMMLPGIWLTCFGAESRFAKMTAGMLAAPVVYFAALAGAPWPALTAVALLAFLASLAAEPWLKPSAASADEPVRLS